MSDEKNVFSADEMYNAVKIGGDGNYICYKLEDDSIYIDDIDIT